MSKDIKRIYVVVAVVLSSLCALCNFEAWRRNSWGKWRRESALSSCLPLPPPIGCSEDQMAKDILSQDDTDFKLLSVLGFTLSLTAMATLTMVVLEPACPPCWVILLTRKKFLLLYPSGAAVMNCLACVIASFRINVTVATMTHTKSLFAVAGLIPVYSSSFFLSMCAAILAGTSAWMVHHTYFALGSGRGAISQTIKQHMARNLMYPDDQRSSKMVTFSSMDHEMEEAAAEICVRAVMRFTMEEDMAENIKQTFEAQFGPTWHCAVGSNFGSAVHHFANEYIEVAMPKTSVLLFRCDTPADHAAPASFAPDAIDLR